MGELAPDISLSEDEGKDSDEDSMMSETQKPKKEVIK